jgi:hypothetical protein
LRYHLERILVCNGTCDRELQENIDQVHRDNDQEYLPENARDCECLAGIGHVHEGAADIQRHEFPDQYAENNRDDQSRD